MSMRSPWWLVLVATAYLAGLAVVLAVQNRDLRDSHAELTLRSRVPQAGMYVPGFRFLAMEGAELALGDPPPGTRQVLLVFDTRCRFCVASLPAWASLYEALREREVTVEVVGVSLDPEGETEVYHEEHALPFPVVSVPERRFRSLYRWGAVPLVMVIEEEGLVSYARIGELDPGPATDSVIAAATGPPEPP
jgi:peroxiredoxin